MTATAPRKRVGVTRRVQTGQDGRETGSCLGMHTVAVMDWRGGVTVCDSPEKREYKPAPRNEFDEAKSAVVYHRGGKRTYRLRQLCYDLCVPTPAVTMNETEP